MNRDAAPLDTRVPAHVRILNASFDESATSPAGLIVRGRVDPSTLRFLRIDSYYQRKAEHRPALWEAFRNGVIPPDIDVGVRGQDFETDGADCIIRAPAFIIDGQQRVWNAMQVADHIPGLDIRLGALIHFDTTREWEAHRFTDLNRNAKPVKPSVHLRNWRDRHVGVATLYGLTHNEPGFVLHDRVCWEQNMLRGQVINAYQLARVTVFLHAHKVSMPGGGVDAMAAAVDAAAQAVRLAHYRANCRLFFEVLDEAFGIRSIEFRHGAAHIKSQFLVMLARLFSRHVNFWEEDHCRLAISADWRRTLARFPIADPQVVKLAGSGGASRDILYEMLRRHMDSGKRVNRLEPRHGGPRGD